jgi:hypothetical protein
MKWAQKGWFWGRFVCKKGRLAHKNQQKSQKIDVDFEIFLLILKWLSAISSEKMTNHSPCFFFGSVAGLREGSAVGE